MSRSYTEVVTELKILLKAYFADPGNHAEDDIQRLIEELNWVRLPEPPSSAPSPCPPNTSRPDGGDDSETSGAS